MTSGIADYCWELLQASRSRFVLLVFSNWPLAVLRRTRATAVDTWGLGRISACPPPQQHLEKPHPHSLSMDPDFKSHQDPADPAWCLVRLTALQLRDMVPKRQVHFTACISQNCPPPPHHLGREGFIRTASGQRGRGTEKRMGELPGRRLDAVTWEPS